MSALRRTLPLAVVLALLFGAALVVPAAAGTTYKTSFAVSLKFPAFHGKLVSSYAYCTQGRTVKLYREKGGPDKLLGSDTSTPDGKWSIPIGSRLISGSYYATAQTKTSSEVAVTCRAGKSKVIVVD